MDDDDARRARLAACEDAPRVTDGAQAWLGAAIAATFAIATAVVAIWWLA